MNTPDFPGEPVNLSESTEEDIPVAVRDTPDTRQRSRWQPFLIILAVLGGGAIVLALILSSSTSQSPQTVTASPQPTTTDTSTPATPEESESENDVDNLLGHLPYEEAPLSELEPITSDGRIQLREAAAKKFKAMRAAAQADGIVLVAISGYRTQQQQQHLFFDIKAQRGQVATQRAEVSAPPGYSEHHTGYAVDIGDGRTPATNLNTNFENTAAFKWLEKNAAYYSFELSFPKGNPQGVSYEPWHWRFVGDPDSLETFYKAQHLDRPDSEPSPSSSEPEDDSSTKEQGTENKERGIENGE
ncbi:MAG: D-alanyl-D-alanine carboxypeptidase family protein [Coleofasciculus sp. C1-SOL-03]|uniref:M15 family metallopeptidase n=1 Tax=Coleofasciculus sp. C1-SOL-03 TaxID=3069522 RepID=UPI0032F9AFC6